MDGGFLCGAAGASAEGDGTSASAGAPGRQHLDAEGYPFECRSPFGRSRPARDHRDRIVYCTHHDAGRERISLASTLRKGLR